MKGFFMLLYKKLIAFGLTVLLFSIALPASAHNLPMGASRWSFGKNSIVAEFDFKQVLFAEIKGIKEGAYDLNSVSDRELEWIARDVIQPYINDKLSVTVAGTSYPIKVNRITRNENGLFTTYLSIDNVRFKSQENPVKIVYTLLFDETGADHYNLTSLYLTDAKGDELQKIFALSPPSMQTSFDFNTRSWDFTIKGPQNGASNNEAQSPGPDQQAFLSTLREFIPIGIEHIWTGYDHIAFLLALIVIGLSLKEALKIITAFTVAHSITLLLAATQILSLNSRFVESVIALSICYVAVENILKKKVNYRWLIAFGFGLVHGFGFASALQELIVGKANLLLSVLSFNAGVEIGQLTIVCALMPLLYLLKKKFELRIITMGASVSIFIFGFTWLIERVFDLKLLWF
jgi:hydrogenase/urease accessory protein HupE